MSDAPPREWRFYIDDMIGCAEKVMAYTHGLDQAAFVASGLNYDATVRNLELMGEAATQVPDVAVRLPPLIRWGGHTGGRLPLHPAKGPNDSNYPRKRRPIRCRRSRESGSPVLSRPCSLGECGDLQLPGFPPARE